MHRRSDAPSGGLISSPVLALIMVLALLATACGNQGASGSPGVGSPTVAAPTDGEATPGEESPSDGEPTDGGTATTCTSPPAADVQLTIWNPFTGPDGPPFVDLADAFTAAHPNITTNVQTQPGGEYIQRLEAAAAANQLPHVAAMGYDQIPQHAENQIISPIDDLADQLGLSADDFSEVVWNGGVWKDQRYGIPIDVHPMVFYYNKALFTEAGLDPESPPTDEASFEEAISAISESTEADGYMMVASGPGANFLVGLQWSTLFYQGGGQWTNEDYSQATFNSEAGVQAAEYLAHLVNDLGVPKVESDAEINAFKQGQNGMVFSGVWETSGYADALGDDLGVAPVPQIFGEGVWAGSHNLTVTTSAEGDTRAAAYCFIEWFSNNSVAWANAGQVPARNSQRETIGEQEGALIPFIEQIAPMFDGATLLPTIPGSGDMLFAANGAGEAATLVINGTKSAQQALDDAANYNSQILAENKQDYGF